MKSIVFILLAPSLCKAFVIKGIKQCPSLRMNNDENSSKKSGPFQELIDIFSNFDDVVDDFFYKRMGQGEVFYGKRKYKPSGKVEGDYNGFGLSDKMKIDMTREYKEEWLEEKKMRDEIRMLKEERENRK
jgi:protein-arginine kinase activator protein McsA